MKKQITIVLSSLQILWGLGMLLSLTLLPDDGLVPPNGSLGIENVALATLLVFVHAFYGVSDVVGERAHETGFPLRFLILSGLTAWVVVMALMIAWSTRASVGDFWLLTPVSLTLLLVNVIGLYLLSRGTPNTLENTMGNNGSVL